MRVARSLVCEYAEAAAVVAFRCAVSMHAGAARLWNRVRATLANDDESDEALHAYQRAVDLSPLHARVGNFEPANGNRVNHGEVVRFCLRAVAATARGDEKGRSGRRTPMEDEGRVWGHLRSAR